MGKIDTILILYYTIVEILLAQNNTYNTIMLNVCRQTGLILY